MSLTANSGPFLSYGAVTQANGTVTEYNDERGPSIFDLGTLFADPRGAFSYKPGSRQGTDIFGFFNNRYTVDYIPSAISSNLLMTSTFSSTNSFAFTTANPVTAPALIWPTCAIAVNLFSSKTGITPTTIVAPETGRATGTLLCIDSTAVMLGFGPSNTVNAWNPAGGAGRCLAITTSSSGDGPITISGRDFYGFKITETLALTDTTRASTNAAGITVKTLKAYKYIASVVMSTTTTSTGVGIGTNDTYGFPLFVNYLSPDTSVFISTTAYNSSGTVVLTSATITLGATATATSTTGDVRGTYASTTASDGSSVRFVINRTITPAMAFGVSNSDYSSVFGVTQYSSV
jgi:hypothetical protein